MGRVRGGLHAEEGGHHRRAGSTIAEIRGGAFGAAWAPDDTIIVGTTDATTGLQRVSAAGGELTVLPQPARAGANAYAWPEMLPGGRAVLFTIGATTGGLDAAQIAVLDLATRTAKVLVRGGSHAHYVPSGLSSPKRAERERGHLVYAAGGGLRAVPFDLARLETRGTAVTVLPRLITSRQERASLRAADGTLAYVDAPDAASPATRTLVWVDRQGREESAGRARAPLLPSARVAGRDAGGGGHRRPGERHLAVGSRTPDAQPLDVRFPFRVQSRVDAGRPSAALRHHRTARVLRRQTGASIRKQVYRPDRLAGFPYDVAPDGRFLMIKPSEEEQSPPRLNVVLNWVDETPRVGSRRGVT